MVDTRSSARTEMKDEAVSTSVQNEEDWELSDHVRNLLKQREDLLGQLFQVDCNIRQTTAEILDTLSVVTVVLERQMGVKFDEAQGAHEALELGEDEATPESVQVINDLEPSKEENKCTEDTTEKCGSKGCCSESLAGCSPPDIADDCDENTKDMLAQNCDTKCCVEHNDDNDKDKTDCGKQNCPDTKCKKSGEEQDFLEGQNCLKETCDLKRNNSDGTACVESSHGASSGCQSNCIQKGGDGVKVMKMNCENSSLSCCNANKENCGESVPHCPGGRGVGNQPLKTLTQLQSMQGSLLKQEKYLKKIERNHKLRPTDSLDSSSSDSGSNQGSLKVPSVLESQLAKIQHNIGQARRQLQTLQQQLHTLATRRHQLQPHPDNCLVDAELTKTEARLQQIMMRLELASLRKDIVHQMMT